MRPYQWVLLGIGIALLGSSVALALVAPKLPLPVTGGIGTAGMAVITAAVASSRAFTITLQFGSRNGKNGNGNGGEH